MLTRQKIMLNVLAFAVEPIGRTALVKLAFLLKHETAISQDATFYDFVPYKYGPFSFALYRELEALKSEGLIAGEDKISLPESLMKMADARSMVESLPNWVRSSTERLFVRYGRVPFRKLVRDVYARYPWYATRSELFDLLPSPTPTQKVAPIAVYTAGYESKSVDQFFQGILKSGVKSILDVRANPISRKWGFAKKSLKEIAGKLGLDYHHLPELGIPSEHRADLSDEASFQRLFDSYYVSNLREKKEAVEAASVLVKEKPSALLCLEKNADCCHRSRLAKAISGVTGLPTIHLT
jgi:uncharacterized protein (DUF488 family)